MLERAMKDRVLVSATPTGRGVAASFPPDAAFVLAVYGALHDAGIDAGVYRERLAGLVERAGDVRRRGVRVVLSETRGFDVVGRSAIGDYLDAHPVAVVIQVERLWRQVRDELRGQGFAA